MECGTPIIIPRNLVLRDSRVLDQSFFFIESAFLGRRNGSSPTLFPFSFSSIRRKYVRGPRYFIFFFLQKGQNCYEDNKYIDGEDVGNESALSPSECEGICVKESICKSWMWHKIKHRCYMKGVDIGTQNLKESENAISGPKICGINRCVCVALTATI